MSRDFKVRPSVNGETIIIASDSIDALGDVEITSVADDQVLTYDSSTSKWKNAAPAAGGGAASRAFSFFMG